MATADLITELAGDIQDCYSAVNTKGGTVPQNKNTNNLATAIGTIPTGITPTGTISITQNGTVDVTQYASANVNVQETIYFTNHGAMYQETMHITNGNNDGFYNNAYRNADKMKELYVPNLYTIWTATGYVFQNCTALQKAELTIYGMIGTYFFGGCTSLKSVLFGYKDNNTYSIGANTFNGCSVFDTLILTGNKLCSLENVNSFTSTPFRDTIGSGGTVYVPQALISTYEADTNWSALENCTFAAIEGSEYDDS